MPLIMEYASCIIEGSMVTAIWQHLRMHQNSFLVLYLVKCWILLKLVLGGVSGVAHFSTAHEQAQSKNTYQWDAPQTIQHNISVFVLFVVCVVCRSVLSLIWMLLGDAFRERCCPLLSLFSVFKRNVILFFNISLNFKIKDYNYVVFCYLTGLKTIEYETENV